MKKISVLAIAFAAVLFAACGGNKSAQTEENADSAKSFEQEQIEAAIKMHFDSIAAEIGAMKQLPFLMEGENGLQLTQEEKQVKPDYLLSAAAADEAATLAEKYRILSALNVDKKIATLYEMPTDDYDKAVTKLMADINDPSFKAVEDSNTLYETSQALYDAMNENGRINCFWQMAAAALVEEIYIANQNSEKFLANFTDDNAANITYRIILILDAVKNLSQYDADIEPVAAALAPLDVLNATTVTELKDQLAASKEQIIAARKALVK
jgi:hypothetical protein